MPTPGAASFAVKLATSDPVCQPAPTSAPEGEPTVGAVLSVRVTVEAYSAANTRWIAAPVLQVLPPVAAHSAPSLRLVCERPVSSRGDWAVPRRPPTRHS